MLRLQLLCTMISVDISASWFGFTSLFHICCETRKKGIKISISMSITSQMLRNRGNQNNSTDPTRASSFKSPPWQCSSFFFFYSIFFLIIFFNKSSLFESWIHDKVWGCLLHLRALLSIPNQLILVSFTFTTLGSEIHFLKGKQMAIKTMKLKRTQTRLKTLSLRLPMSVGTCRVEILILVFFWKLFSGGLGCSNCFNHGILGIFWKFQYMIWPSEESELHISGIEVWQNGNCNRWNYCFIFYS